MNKEQAAKRGYEFTGIYERDKSGVQVRLNKIRKDGYKAALVTVPDDPLSRGCIGRGYSIYAEARYRLDDLAKTHREQIAQFPARILRITEQFSREIAETVAIKANQQEWLRKNGYAEA